MTKQLSVQLPGMQILFWFWKLHHLTNFRANGQHVMLSEYKNYLRNMLDKKNLANVCFFIYSYSAFVTDSTVWKFGASDLFLCTVFFSLHGQQLLSGMSRETFHHVSPFVLFSELHVFYTGHYAKAFSIGAAQKIKIVSQNIYVDQSAFLFAGSGSSPRG